MTWEFTDDMDRHVTLYPTHGLLKFLLCKVAINIQHFMKISMLSWRTTLTLNGRALGHVEIKRGIF